MTEQPRAFLPPLLRLNKTTGVFLGLYFEDSPALPSASHRVPFSFPMSLHISACLLRTSARACTQAALARIAHIRIRAAKCAREESVSRLAFDSASNKRRTRFLLSFFFPPFSKVGHELLSAASNYQPCGKIRGGREMESEKKKKWSRESELTKQRQDWGLLGLSRNDKGKDSNGEKKRALMER